eukprot:TRINITY_DN21439_c0_g1_i1.p1 TRINITY_DN21439_c0_g1~~TRINITY_DN21439_c0_g1_i1.p1  ORF type:complete len:191 (+),score=14.28 TRINITY_DN21439_c0_g1_i1:65-637(+)
MTPKRGIISAIAFGCLASLVLTADGTSVTCRPGEHCQMEGEENYGGKTNVLLQKGIHGNFGKGMVHEAAQESVHGGEGASDEDGEFGSDEDSESTSDHVNCPSTTFCPEGQTFLPVDIMEKTMVTKKRSCSFFLPRKKWPCTGKREKQRKWQKIMRDLCCAVAPTEAPAGRCDSVCEDLRVNGNLVPEDE